MNILVFQHIDCEHPGIFRQFFREESIEWTTVKIDQGEPIPSLSHYDALWVMGGPMDVWDTDEHPWLIDEKEAIRHWVMDLGKPYFGLCLGHQLLADAVGGRCAVLTPPEVGILEVHLNAQGQDDPLFHNIPTTMTCLQWHSVEVATLPEGATVLAESAACSCQAMRVNRHAYGLQYHVELEQDTISNWGQIPAYAHALAQTLGADALATMEQNAQPHYADMAANARQLLTNFIDITQQA